MFAVRFGLMCWSNAVAVIPGLTRNLCKVNVGHGQTLKQVQGVGLF